MVGIYVRFGIWLPYLTAGLNDSTKLLKGRTLNHAADVSYWEAETINHSSDEGLIFE